MATNILRLPAVLARTGVSRSTIYKMVSIGSFPAPVRIGMRAVAWVEQDIEKWLAGRILASARSRDGLAAQREYGIRPLLKRAVPQASREGV